ncbi:MAG: monovalent cation/H(+) antiporter subunit G [Acidobacteriota bacterium]|nr:monovalent cation/H(+) antiporter subunit G [Acidobacteriota bacterium]MDH3786300.1 monovalent cation/H(+) antiporter subunit G [Acidobacteriota bacterium]
MNSLPILESIGWGLMAVGGLFAMIGGLGLLRLPDLYTRMHGAGITDTLGATLILAGLSLHSGFSLITVKLFAIWFFLLVTSPTSTHALARAAMSHGIRPEISDTEERSSNS